MLNESSTIFDVELWLRAMLIITAICALISAGLVIAGTIYLIKAQQYWRKVTRPPEVVRDSHGRPIHERI